MARIINSDLSSLEENEYENEWRLKQAITPFNEKMGVYDTAGYQIIFEKKFNQSGFTGGNYES